MGKALETHSVIDLLTQRATVRRAARVSLVVGSILVAINQWEAVIGNTSINVLKVFLTYLVPYCVSSYSSVMAQLDFQSSQHAEENR